MTRVAWRGLRREEGGRGRGLGLIRKHIKTEVEAKRKSEKKEYVCACVNEEKERIGRQTQMRGDADYLDADSGADRAGQRKNESERP